jgi:serine/threonine protein kinase
MTANDSSIREQLLDEALARYLRELDGGHTPDFRALVDQFPELAGYFAGLERMTPWIEPLQSVSRIARINESLTELDADATASQPSSPAWQLDAYELIEPIARGGMGIVYKARERRLNRLVALKMLVGEPTSIDLQRFRNEAEAVASLDHPNIVPIYEVGDCGGQAFFSMKLIDGGSLAGQLSRFVVDPRAGARLLATVARAVEYAHQRGILHRDLKPANILLEWKEGIDRPPVPHVADFGLAKRLGPGDSDLTESGAVVGTPAYMAPEQATKTKSGITVATDVYGLGAILYALLTGQPPFRGETGYETMGLVCTARPEPPRKLNPNVPRDLELICLKCLEKEFHLRYPSCAALADELERFLEGKPLALTRPVGSAERLWRLCRRNPVVSGLITGTALLLVAVAVISTVAYYRLKETTEQRDANRARARNNMDVARTAIGYFAKLSENPELQKRGLERLRHEMVRQAQDFFTQLNQIQPDEPGLQADLGRSYLQLGKTLGVLRSLPEAIAAFHEAQTVFERLSRTESNAVEFEGLLAQALLEQGTYFQLSDLMDDARSVIGSALPICQRLADSHPGVVIYEERLARAYFQLGRLNQVTNQPDKALAVYDEALTRFRELATSRSESIYRENVVRTLMNMGTAYMLPSLTQVGGKAGNRTEANKCYTEADKLSAQLDARNPEHQNLRAEVLHLKGRALRSGKRPEDALEQFEAATKILNELVRIHKDVPEYRFRLAGALHAQALLRLEDLKQIDRAREFYQNAAQLMQSLFDDYDLPDYAREWGQLCYDRACLEGLEAAALLKDPAIAPAERKRRSDEHVQAAVEQLRHSWKSGFLRSRSALAHLKIDTDLDSLRNHRDFVDLLDEFERALSAPPAP